jgi:hypothetical protein
MLAARRRDSSGFSEDTDPATLTGARRDHFYFDVAGTGEELIAFCGGFTKIKIPRRTTMITARAIAMYFMVLFI